MKYLCINCIFWERLPIGVNLSAPVAACLSVSLRSPAPPKGGATGVPGHSALDA